MCGLQVILVVQVTLIQQQSNIKILMAIYFPLAHMILRVKQTLRPCDPAGYRRICICN